MRYDGKKGFWWMLILILFNLALVWCIVEWDKYNGFIICLIALVAGDVFLLSLNARTYVEIKGNELIIVLGINKKIINCNTITSLEKTHCPIASMALSLDRIRINYGSDCVYVSVKDNSKLINDLKSLFPNIKVNNM